MAPHVPQHAGLLLGKKADTLQLLQVSQGQGQPAARTRLTYCRCDFSVQETQAAVLLPRNNHFWIPDFFFFHRIYTFHMRGVGSLENNVLYIL